MDEMSVLQQALSMPQTTSGVEPLQREVMGPEMVDPVAEIQEQLEAITAAMQQTEDANELRQLAGVARELQLALEEQLQKPLAQPQASELMTYAGGMGA